MEYAVAGRAASPSLERLVVELAGALDRAGFVRPCGAAAADLVVNRFEPGAPAWTRPCSMCSVSNPRSAHASTAPTEKTERTNMALEMRGRCERCGARLASNGAAYICSYECTFCLRCNDAMGAICSNCGGELVRRPRREPRR